MISSNNLPPRGQPLIGARHVNMPSSFAVQPPALTSVEIKLKKKSVVVVRAGNSKVNNTAPHSAANELAPKETDDFVLSPQTRADVNPSNEIDTGKAVVDKLFTRLMNNQTEAPHHTVSPIPAFDSDKVKALLEKRLGIASLKDEVSQHSQEVAQCRQTEQVETVSDVTPNHFKIEENFEQEYMQIASDLINALPEHPDSIAFIFKTVFKKLQNAYMPSGIEDAKDVKALKARFVFAITSHVNKVLKKGTAMLTVDRVNRIMANNGGNFLLLCGILVEEQYIALETIDDVVRLCKSILDMLPNAEPVRAGIIGISPLVTAISPFEAVEGKTKGLTQMMKGWPTQEAREHASHRSVILKGIASFTSINELQALVWGGRLEAITRNEQSDTATIRFLTAESCMKYFKATENGIDIAFPGNNRVVHVEKATGPSSANDVIRKCADGDASRCVRAVGTDDNWSYDMLLRLAGSQGREIDCIEQGKTAGGHHYIDFRFADIYHALNFKRQLMGDSEWEHCAITYGTDPCETATGPHLENSKW